MVPEHVITIQSFLSIRYASSLDCFFDKNLPFFTFEDMINDIDYKEVALLSSCDRLGRGQMTSLDKERELNNIKKFKKYCKDIERRNK